MAKKVTVDNKYDPDGIYWQEIVEEGLKAKVAQDKGFWILGDLASEVETGYGAHALQRFAKAINLNHNTLARYRDVSRAFPTAEREPGLSFAHHKSVSAKEDRLELLKRAVAEKWTVSRMMLMAKPPAEERTKRAPLVPLTSTAKVLAALNSLNDLDPNILAFYSTVPLAVNKEAQARFGGERLAFVDVLNLILPEPVTFTAIGDVYIYSLAE